MRFPWIHPKSPIPGAPGSRPTPAASFFLRAPRPGAKPTRKTCSRKRWSKHGGAAEENRRMRHSFSPRSAAARSISRAAIIGGCEGNRLRRSGFAPAAESAARDEELEEAVKTLPPSLREVLVLKLDVHNVAIIDVDPSRPIRLIRATWLDDITYAGDDGHSTLRRSEPRTEILSVPLDSF
jgi:hypothetical protein